uniref:Uncharacterized protein n=1 Tax=Knipowitschia caucasica TaxID=637954 RepID=A0AAV2M3R2_KNICA
MRERRLVVRLQNVGPLPLDPRAVDCPDHPYGLHTTSLLLHRLLLHRLLHRRLLHHPPVSTTAFSTTAFSPPPPSPPPPSPPPRDSILAHPLVVSGRIPPDLADLLMEVKFHRSQGRLRRNISKARILTAEDMATTIEEAEDRAARREAQALARRDREQQRA